ncbi:MAG: M10 family metallopeptidase domain-containing protein [Sandaracinaceae bacterium]|nr:M10 family metallopeptidase domain-containing protein [Sandaracinaceae bacterium]
MSRRVLAALAIAAALSAGTASAWEPIYPTQPVWRPPVPYSLNQAGSVDLGGFAATEPEVRRGMDDWTRVSCTSLTTNYRGMTSAVPGSYEGTSTIGWIESGWRHGSSAIGVTGPRWGSYIVEADMELNGVNFTWTTGSGSGSRVNAYSIVLHEGGHYYGLGHSNVRGSSMWPSYSGGSSGSGPTTRPASARSTQERQRLHDDGVPERPGSAWAASARR